MKLFLCLLIILFICFVNSSVPRKYCNRQQCSKEPKRCPDGRPAPVPQGQCCPSIKACKRKPQCSAVFCPADFKICPDGKPAPIPPGQCCPSLRACRRPGYGK